MTASDYHVAPDPMWMILQMQGWDGYDRIAKMESRWHAVPNWGRDGWDLGDWPYVVVFTRTRRDEVDGEIRYDLAVNVEGDVDQYAYPTESDRNDAIDGLALYYWRYHNAPWLTEEPPDALKGPYTRTRQGVPGA